MGCSICGQDVDRSGSSTGVRWFLSRENKEAAEDVTGELCANCGEFLGQGLHTNMVVDYRLKQRFGDEDESEDHEVVSPLRMNIVESRRPVK